MTAVPAGLMSRAVTLVANDAIVTLFDMDAVTVLPMVTVPEMAGIEATSTLNPAEFKPAPN